MKQLSKILLVLIVIGALNAGCGSSSKTLDAGSSLLNAMSGNPSLSGISSLLQTPGLANALGSAIKKPFTLLAPTNNALSALGANAMSNLAKPENLNNLVAMLKNHIVPGKYGATDLTNSTLNTASGHPLNIRGANIGNLISSDAANVFPIDKVLQ